MTSPIYLVPCDFSPKFKGALRLGIDLAEYNKGSVMLIHIISKKSEKAIADQKMKKVLADINESERQMLDYRILVGEIYEDISKAAEVLNAALIVMSTHGATGLQKIRGSHALRMVDSSHIPFMITQGEKYVDKMKHIVMPFCDQKDSLQVVKYAATIAKQFDSTVHLAGYLDKDETTRSRTLTNHRLLLNFFTEQDIKVETHNIDSKEDYVEALMGYAKKVDADLFAATFFNTTIFSGINSFLQTLIENDDDIPVLTVNAEENSISSISSVMM